MNPRRLALALSCLLIATLVLALLAWRLDRPPVARAAEPSPQRVEGSADGAEEAEAVAVLRAWDDRRTRAWAAADVAGLGRLYTADSRTGRNDRAMLQEYADRGLRVPGLRMQLLAVDVQSRSSRRLELLVTDRLAGGVAVGHGVRVRLPTDRASTRLVTLVRAVGEWRVAEVQAPAATRTASTSRSWKR